MASPSESDGRTVTTAHAGQLAHGQLVQRAAIQDGALQRGVGEDAQAAALASPRTSTLVVRCA
jgi:hypothetical protein